MQPGRDDQALGRGEAEPADIVGVIVEGAFDVGEHAGQTAVVGRKHDMIVAVGQR